MSEDQFPLHIDRVRKLSPFNDLSDSHIREILKHSATKSLASGKMLFKRGENSKVCYYLLEGAIDLLNESFEISALHADTPATLHPIDNQLPHQLSAVTTGKSLVLMVDKNHMDIVLTWDQAGNYLVTDLASEGSIERDWMTCLLESSLMAQVPPANIQQLFVAFHQKSVKEGDTIVQEGQHGDQFYVLESGQANVLQSIAGQQKIVAQLSVGNYFGEEALVGNTTRNASIIMTSNGSLMYLTKEDFKRLLQEPVQQFIDHSELDVLLGKNRSICLVDVRLPGEYKFDKLDGSINIPLNQLRDKFASLSKDSTYIIFCDGGRRSELGAYLLTEAGFDTKILKKTPSAVC
ncbi:hypothetical protein A9Q99_15820 [Gammaproteobacteria bacterium 45_16_T64]|nr:hypothetical protein A9Q99_15820 [Gammaproteobacteria bacterium 45_16_T64]